MIRPISTRLQAKHCQLSILDSLEVTLCFVQLDTFLRVLRIYIISSVLNYRLSQFIYSKYPFQSCEACKTRRKSTKRYTLYRLPKILVVHLKRFSGSERTRQKMSSVVNFPLSGLSLSRYTDSVTSSSYSCYAISNHSGTLYSGHYTAYAKHPQSGQWHLYNDARYTVNTANTVLHLCSFMYFITEHRQNNLDIPFL